MAFFPHFFCLLSRYRHIRKCPLPLYRWKSLISTLCICALLGGNLPAFADTTPAVPPVTAVPATDTPAVAPPAPATTNKQQGSDIALCDPNPTDNSKPKGSCGTVPGSCGADVNTFPTFDPKNRKPFNDAATSFQQTWQGRIFKDNDRLHQYYNGQNNKANLKDANDARNAFFLLAFKGGGNDGNNGAIINICGFKRSVKAEIDKWSSNPPDVNACSDSFEAMRQLVSSATDHYNKLQDGLTKVVGGTDAKGNAVNGIAEQQFSQDYGRDHNAVHDAKNMSLFDSGDQATLEKEVKSLWGSDNYNNSAPKSGGFFSDMLLQAITERNNTVDTKKKLDDMNLKMVAWQKSCNSADPSKKSLVTGDLNKVADITKNPNPTITGGGNPGDGGDLPAKNVSTTKTPNPTSSGITNFMKDNWMIIAGGAAAVGGVVWYEHNQQQQAKQQADIANDMAMMSVNQNPTAVNSTTTATEVINGGSSATVNGASPGNSVTVTSGSTLQVLDAVPGAVQGQAMSPVRVVVVGPGGGSEATSGLNISASCVTACSLSGTTTATTDATGTATFSGLTFTQAATGMQLQFSAAGFTSVTTPGSFNVSSSSGNGGVTQQSKPQP